VHACEWIWTTTPALPFLHWEPVNDCIGCEDEFLVDGAPCAPPVGSGAFDGDIQPGACGDAGPVDP
jgi:hypothetical protein